MLADFKFVALAQKAKYARADALTARQVLEMATIKGARAVGMEHEIGSLEAGKKADLVLVDLDRPHLYPRVSVPSVLVYQANGSEIHTVVVDGRVLLDDGRLVAAEPDVQLVQAAAERIAREARLTGPMRVT